jgi:hypothetical protein
MWNKISFILLMQGSLGMRGRGNENENVRG